MLLSRYHKTFAHPHDPEALLLFSTRTTALVILDHATYAALERGEAVEGSEGLLDCGLLVSDHRQEKEEVLNYLDEVNSLSSRLSAAVILGMRCNFACTYCYEGESKGAFDMDAPTARRLPDFLLEQCKPGYERIAIDFYGGEPLLYREQIKSIAGRMQELCSTAGLAFDFALVSNGSLLRPELVEELLPFGLVTVKITLDGPAATHDRCRPFKNGAPSFAAVLKNIKDCAGRLTINVGGNYTRESYPRFPELLDELAAAGLGPKDINRLSFTPVIQPEQEQLAPLSFHGGCQSVSEPWLPEAAIFLRQQLLNYGWDPEGITPTPCMVDRNNTFTIHYDGNIYQCPALIGQQELVCGDIHTGIQDYSKQYQVKNWQKHKKCQECLYLLLCFGGCRFMKYRKDLNMDIDCKKEFLDNTLEDFVRQDIQGTAQYQERRIQGGQLTATDDSPSRKPQQKLPTKRAPDVGAVSTANIPRGWQPDTEDMPAPISRINPLPHTGGGENKQGPDDGYR